MKLLIYFYQRTTVRSNTRTSTTVRMCVDTLESGLYGDTPVLIISTGNNNSVPYRRKNAKTIPGRDFVPSRYGNLYHKRNNAI